jgi:hypothetical protein
LFPGGKGVLGYDLKLNVPFILLLFMELIEEVIYYSTFFQSPFYTRTLSYHLLFSKFDVINEIGVVGG